MSSELVRFSVAMPEDLLMSFDAFVARRGLAKNRSEVVRDLVRDALVDDAISLPGTEVMGTLTIVFNHHASDVQEKLHVIQHGHFGMIVSTTHVHLDEDTCLEVIILRGETTDVRAIADQILGTKGVKNGGLVITTTGQMV
ncbi:MAG: nickel-responsive transcriptional regulator NikR [Eggerthellaceae bacterium]|nr:nickel-responsive transcriptional regulator NikR [Eggerthellaceae bacterium]